MKVVILCGGEGSRFKEETHRIPKPLIEVGGMPIVWHVMKIYYEQGFNDFILALGYKGRSIKRWFHEYFLYNGDLSLDSYSRIDNDFNFEKHTTNKENWKVTLVDTGEKTLKGGRIAKLEKYISSDFMLTYADGVADIDLNKLLKEHYSNKVVATLTGIYSTSQFGELEVKKNLVTGFKEKPAGQLINGGFFVFDHSIFDFLSEDENCDLENGALEILSLSNKLGIYQHKGSWDCMDTFKDREKLDNLWKNDEAYWKIWEN